MDDFKKTVLIQRSIDEVKKHALEQELIRNSPDRYRKVKSKIKMNIRSQKKAAAKNKKGSAPRMSLNERQNPFDITEDEMKRVRAMQLNEKSAQKIKKRDEEIKEGEKTLQQISKPATMQVAKKKEQQQALPKAGVEVNYGIHTPQQTFEVRKSTQVTSSGFSGQVITGSVEFVESRREKLLKEAAQTKVEESF